MNESALLLSGVCLSNIGQQSCNIGCDDDAEGDGAGFGQHELQSLTEMRRITLDQTVHRIVQTATREFRDQHRAQHDDHRGLDDPGQDLTPRGDRQTGGQHAEGLPIAGVLTYDIGRPADRTADDDGYQRFSVSYTK